MYVVIVGSKASKGGHHNTMLESHVSNLERSEDFRDGGCGTHLERGLGEIERVEYRSW